MVQKIARRAEKEKAKDAKEAKRAKVQVREAARAAEAEAARRVQALNAAMPELLSDESGTYASLTTNANLQTHVEATWGS